MIVVLVIVTVVAVALLVGLVAATRRAAGAEARAGAAEERSREATERADAADAARQEAESARARSEEAAAAAEERSREATELADAADAARQEALSARDGAEAALAQVREVADAGHPRSGGLWVLEALRLERRWRESVAAGAGGSPFDGSADPARVALGVLVDAAREEAGASFDLTWELSGPVDPETALVLVRAAEELVTAAASATDGGTLAVVGADGSVALHLRTEPPLELPGELAAALTVLGASIEAGPAQEGEEPALSLVLPASAAATR